MTMGYRSWFQDLINGWTMPETMLKNKVMYRQFNVLLTQYCAGGKIEKNEVGGACGAYGGGERCAQGSGGGHLRERDHWEDPDVDGRII